jgi:hypothetical protein
MSMRMAWLAFAFLSAMRPAWCADDLTRPSAQGKLQQAVQEYRAALTRCNTKEVPSPEALTDLAEAAKNLALQEKQAVNAGIRLPGQSITPKSPENPTLGSKAENAFERLKDLRLALSQAPEEGEKKPARFSYTQDFNNGGQGAEFNSEFYLQYFPNPCLYPHDETNEFSASVQGKLSSSDAKSTDSWRFRVEDHFVKALRLTRSEEDKIVFALNVALKEESDRDFRSARVGGEAWVTASNWHWLMGRGWPGPTATNGQETRPPLLRWLALRWSPYLGVDAGGFAEAASLPANARANVWLFGRLTAQVEFPKLETALGFHAVYLYADDTLRCLPETDQIYNYLKAGLNFELNENVGLGLEYTFGFDSPRFLREEKLDAALTLKF